MNQNEDGTYSWKFDNYVRATSPYYFNVDEMHELWSQSAARRCWCAAPQSWAGDPSKDGRLEHFHERQRRVDREGRPLGRTTTSCPSSSLP